MVGASAGHEGAGINYIDPRARGRDGPAAVSTLGTGLCGSDARAIVADALRVPWAPVQLHDHISDLKWWDW